MTETPSSLPPLTTKLGKAALNYATLGWRVFPLEAYDPAWRGDPSKAPGKRPLNLCDGPCFARLPRKDEKTGEMTCAKCGEIHPPNSRGLHMATMDAAIITEWWTRYPDANIGIATGNGLLILDVDGPDAANTLAELEEQHGALPQTPIQQTGKGRHYAFKVEGETRNTASRVGHKIDTRGDGGYIVAAPSIHPTGAQYRWHDERRPSKMPLALAPQWLLDLIAKPKISERASAGIARPSIEDIPEAYVRGAVDGEYNAVAKCPEGRRNDALNTSAFNLGQLVGAGLLAESTARGTLEAAAEACGLPAKEAAGTITSGLAAGIRKPREVKSRTSPSASAKTTGGAATRPQLVVVGGQEAPEPDPERAPAPDIKPPGPRARWLIDDWRDHVVFKDSETAILHPKVVKNAVTMLLHWSELAELFVLNKRTHSILVTYQPPWTGNGTPYPRRMNDSDITGLQCYLETHGLRLGKTSVGDAISYAAHERSVDPVLDTLKALEWDQNPRLDHWLIDCMGADDVSEVRQVSAKWMIAAVARIIRPGTKFDHMLILKGEQGVSKSAAFRILATSVFGDDSYTENLSSIESKDAMIELTGRIIVELAELTVLKKADYDAAKGFLSRLWDDVRLPWDKTTTRLLRSCVFAGTVNPDGMGFLKDPTGNRRYWSVAVQKLDEEKLMTIAPQLWAEAKHRYQAGEKWWIEDQVVLQALREVAMQDTEEDVWGEKIDRFISGRDSVRITEVLESLNIDLGRLTPADNRRVGSHLRKRGWVYTGKQTVRDGKKARWWIAPDGATLFDKVVEQDDREGR